MLLLLYRTGGASAAGVRSKHGKRGFQVDFAARVPDFIRNGPGSSARCETQGKATLVENFDRRAEDVAHATLGDDEARMRWIGFDLSAQPQYLHVDRAVVDLVVEYAAGFEQLVTREDS